MRVLFASTLLAVAALLGCSSEGRCAIDSDCPIRFRCAANACTPIGVSTVDAGESFDTNASFDARATSDTPGPDAPVDAPSGTDTNADAPVADAPVTCPTYVPMQTVSSRGGCLSVTATTVTITGPGAAPGCAIELASDVRGNIAGTMTLVDGTMTGPLSVGMMSYLNCTLTPGSLRAERILTCGTCSLLLTDAP